MNHTIFKVKGNNRMRMAVDRIIACSIQFLATPLHDGFWEIKVSKKEEHVILQIMRDVGSEYAAETARQFIGGK